MATVLLGLMLCLIYPVLVWSVAQSLFGEKAKGSLVICDGKIVGSLLLAQGFESPGYFKPRPSKAAAGYDACFSAASNFGPISKKLIDEVSARGKRYREENGLPSMSMIPADAVTASASGLDPHISPENAAMQVKRVAKARSIDEGKLIELIQECSSSPELGFLGAPRVNVIKLNLMLDDRCRN